MKLFAAVSNSLRPMKQAALPPEIKMSRKERKVNKGF